MMVDVFYACLIIFPYLGIRFREPKIPNCVTAARCNSILDQLSHRWAQEYTMAVESTTRPWSRLEPKLHVYTTIAHTCQQHSTSSVTLIIT